MNVNLKINLKKILLREKKGNESRGTDKRFRKILFLILIFDRGNANGESKF